MLSHHPDQKDDLVIIPEIDHKERPFADVPEGRTSVDNILRLNYSNQLRLTLMADTKANIMITVSSIVFSVTLANIHNEYLRYPLMALGFFSVLALVFAIIVIMPVINFPKDEHGKIDKTSKEYNPLFFGHFAYIDIKEYKIEYAKRLMSDETIIDALTGDIYGIGRVIATNKYRYLRYSYKCFLTGLGLSVIIFTLNILYEVQWLSFQ